MTTQRELEREQTKVFRERFAAEHAMPAWVVSKLVSLGNKAGRENTRYCNGDPYKGCTDKNECSKHWAAELDKTTKRLEALISVFGFSGVQYNGLYPTLTKAGHDVRIPF